jgi:hypothetical protein
MDSIENGLSLLTEIDDRKSQEMAGFPPPMADRRVWLYNPRKEVSGDGIRFGPGTLENQA